MLQSLEQCNERCTNCLCDGALQIDFCLQLLNIYHKAIKSERRFFAFLPKRSTEGSKAKTFFPFVSFPDSYSKIGAARGDIKCEREVFVDCKAFVSPRFPTEEKQLGTKTFLEELFVVFLKYQRC